WEDHDEQGDRGRGAQGRAPASRELLPGLRSDPRGGRVDAAGSDEPRLHELSPVDRVRLALPRGAGGGPALLLDLLGGREGARARRLQRPALQALDRDVRVRGVRLGRAGRARGDRASGGRPGRYRTGGDASSLRDDQPLRVDVLGHRPSAPDLAPLADSLKIRSASTRRPRSGRKPTATRCRASSTARSSSTVARSRSAPRPRLTPSWAGRTASRAGSTRRRRSACAPSQWTRTSETPTTT